jgi:hypothetical protein
VAVAKKVLALPPLVLAIRQAHHHLKEIMVEQEQPIPLRQILAAAAAAAALAPSEAPEQVLLTALAVTAVMARPPLSPVHLLLTQAEAAVAALTLAVVLVAQAAVRTELEMIQLRLLELLTPEVVVAVVAAYQPVRTAVQAAPASSFFATQSLFRP